MNLETEKSPESVRMRLILLWALVEISLGGFLHTFRLPFSGLMVGSIAILSLYLIARRSESYKEVIQAFVVVAALKLAFSPQASPFSYIAMFVQTLCMLPLAKSDRNPGKPLIVSMILLASVYSPVQKILILWLTLGNNLLYGVIDWLQGMLPFDYIHTFVWLPIILWFLLHVIAGVTISVFAIRWKWGLPLEGQLTEKWNDFKFSEPGYGRDERKVLGKGSALILFSVLCIPIFLFYLVSPSTWIMLIIRPIAILSMWFIVVRPLFQVWVRKRQMNAIEKEVQQRLKDVVPMFRRGVLFSWMEAKKVSWLHFPGRFVTVFFTWGVCLSWEN